MIGLTSGPWSLPNQWEWSPFQNVADIAQDLVKPSEVPDAPHIAPDSIESRTRRLLPFRTVCEDGVISPKQRFFTGQVLFTKIRPYLLKSVLAEFDGVCSADMYPLWPKGVEARYLLYWLTSTEFRDLIAFDQGRSVLPKINQLALNATPVPLPPLPEQRRIVTKIDSLSASSKRARDHLDHLPRLVEKYKESVLLAALRGNLTGDWRAANPEKRWTPEELERLAHSRNTYLQNRRGSRLRSHEHLDIGEIPESWAQAQLAEVGELQVGYAYKSTWYVEEGVRLLRGANISPGQLTWVDQQCLSPERAEEFSNYRLNPGDIVIAMDRPLISSGLKVAIVQPEDAGCLLVQRVGRYVGGKLLDQTFAWFVFNSRLFIDHAVSKATGSDLPHISSNDILTTPLPLPPLREQQEVARRVKAAFAWIDRLASEATSARKLIDHLDQAILSKAFRGELVPQDPNDEPASVLLERSKGEQSGRPFKRRPKSRSAIT